MKYISSSSDSGGGSGITATFDIGRDVDLAAVDVQNRVTTAQGRLPAEVNTTGVAITKSGNSFVLAAGFYSENNQYDSLFISNYIDRYLRDPLKRVKGVGDVFVFGERKYSMRLWLDPARMASRQLTATDVVKALREQNVQVAAGQIGQPPSPTGQSFQIGVRAVGRLSEPAEFNNIILKSTPDGILVRLKDVGRAELGAESYGSILEYNNQPIIGLGITQLSNANALLVDDTIVVIENVERHLREGMHDPRRATTVAMGEVAGAVIATSLVLVAVFVPVAFFPGSTGILFRQFALTIAFSVAISAFNALTLTPAISALLMGKTQHEHGRFFTTVNRVIQNSTEWYRNHLGNLFRWKGVMTVLFLAGLVATYFVYRLVPRSFVPEEDEGYFIALIQAPPGASLEYTNTIAHQVVDKLNKVPEIEGAFAVSGFSFIGSAPNRGLIFVNMKDLSQRPGDAHSTAAVIDRIRPMLFGVTGAVVFPTAPPAISGLGEFGGFTMELQDLGGHSLDDFGNVTQSFMGALRSDKRIGGLFSGFTTNDPQFVVSIDREKAKSLDVPLGQITDALEVYMGSSYVNDFDFNNRSYRVYVQADQRYRSQPSDIGRFYVRSDRGAMIPLQDLVKVTPSTTPQVISHYNLLRSAEIQGSASPGHSSGEAITAVQEVAAQKLPPGYAYEWTGLSLEEIQSGGQAAALFGLGLLVVYLTLAAQYESWVLPFIVLLAVPMAMLGALGAQRLRGLENDVYCQIGLVMLIALASKNSILIVEFAEQLREKGLSIAEAAVEAARIRLRPILMTSMAFLLGVLPLVLATGAGRAGRHSVGTTVFGGMIAGTFLNLLFVPVLYIVVRTFAHGGVRGRHEEVVEEEALASD